MNQTIAAAALLLLTGMTSSAEERLRVDGSATLPFTAHAGATYRITTTSRCNCYAMQPRVVVPTLAITDQAGAQLAAANLVRQIDDAKFALQTELTFTAPADGTYTLVITADQGRNGTVIGSFLEKTFRPGFGGGAVLTDYPVTNEVSVRGASSGVVAVGIVEAAN